MVVREAARSAESGVMQMEQRYSCRNYRMQMGPTLLQGLRKVLFSKPGLCTLFN
jgi:hypothetical protein